MSQTPNHDPDGMSSDETTSPWPLLSSRRSAVAGLASTAVLGGLAEALFLVIVTRTAFAITDGDESFGLVAGAQVNTTEAIAIALVLVLVRVGLAVATKWQSSRLSASVIAEVRRDLAHAFMQASWSSQHGERSGRLAGDADDVRSTGR